MCEKAMSLVAIAAVCAIFCSFTEAMAQDKKFLEDYKGSAQVPDDLYSLYEKFVAALETGDRGNIEPLCLPFSVTFTTEPRKKGIEEYGADINLPYLKTGFHPRILTVRKDGEGLYLLRTASTALRFVETKSLGWKLYGFLDKPIE